MRNIYKNLLNTLEKHPRVSIITTLTDSVTKELCIHESSDSDLHSSSVGVKNSKTIITEPFYREDRLLVFGGGHVAHILSEIAAKIGFSVIVTEDRPEFGNAERFPWAKKVYCEQFDKVIDSMTISSSDYIVLLTRGHFYDKMCLKALYKQEKCAYLGILASKRRMSELTSQLFEDGIEKDWMAQIHSPVGLNIGAVTSRQNVYQKMVRDVRF